LILSGVNDSVYQTMLNSGFVHEIGREYIFPHIQMALAKAEEIALKKNLPKMK